MKKTLTIWLSFGAPLMILLAVLASQPRQGSDRVQALPAVLVGSGLIISCAVGRRRRRGKLLKALRSSRAQPD